MKHSSVWTAGGCLVVIALGSGVARAQTCDASLSINSNCWNDYSGQNFSQVAAGNLPLTTSQGLVCGVTAGGPNNWGGDKNMYSTGFQIFPDYIQLAE